jgi:uncharacterized membrane protein YbhN (UPF0104 family)
MSLLRSVVRWGLVLAALAWTVSRLPPLLHSAGAAVEVLAQLSVGHVVAAGVLGLAAVAAYAELHRQLLVAGGARPSAVAVQSITLAQNAIGNTVPVVGGAGALAYAVGTLRRRGVDGALAAWAVLAAGALSTFCLAPLAIGALVLTGVLSLPAAAPLLAGVAGTAAAAATLLRHPGVLRSALVRVLALRRHLPRAGGGAGVAAAGRAADEALARLVPLVPSAPQWARLIAVSAVTWVLDFATLVAAAAAVPGSLHWDGLVKGFLVVQASIALQLLPGGAGLAELGLLGALLGSGVAAGPAAVVVLVYRASSWLVPSVLGWLTYGAQLTPLARPADGPPQPVAVPCEAGAGRCMGA